MCEGASRDEVLFDIDAQIARRGWALQGVVDERGDGWDWAYTIGLAARGHPELVVVAPRDRDVREVAAPLDEAAMLVSAGFRFETGDGGPVSVGRAVVGDAHPDHMQQGLLALWFAYHASPHRRRPNLRVRQLVLPEAPYCARHQVAVPLLEDPLATVVRPAAA